VDGGVSFLSRCAVRGEATSSILKPRRTIDRAEEETEIVTKGRDDPCVGIRTVSVGEAMKVCVLAGRFLGIAGRTESAAGRASRA